MFSTSSVPCRLVIDFGNSLPIKCGGSYAVEQIKRLMVALPKSAGKSAKEACANNDLLYADEAVAYKEENWYQNHAGIQVFNLHSSEMIKELTSRALMVVKVRLCLPTYTRQGRLSG